MMKRKMMKRKMMKKMMIVFLAGALLGATGCGGTIKERELLAPPSFVKADISDRVSMKGTIWFDLPVTGMFTGDIEYFAYFFNGQAGGVITAEITKSGSSQGLDTVLYLFGPKNEAGAYGENFLTYDFDSGHENLSKISAWELPANGEYLLVVGTKYGSGRGAYRLFLSCDNGACSNDQGGQIGDPCNNRFDCDIENGETCNLVIDSTGYFGRCYASGALETGTECNPNLDPQELSFEERCKGYFCEDGHCTEVCSKNADCQSVSEHQVCANVFACMQYDPQGNCTRFTDVGLCHWLEGSQAPCAGTKDCMGTGNNGANEICESYVSQETGTAEKICVKENCDPQDPSQCLPIGTKNCDESNTPCYGDLCIVGMDGATICSEPCNTNNDCSMQNSICVPTVVGPNVTTGVCMENPFCQRHADCVSDNPNDPEKYCTAAYLDDTDPNRLKVLGQCSATDGLLKPGEVCDPSVSPYDGPSWERCASYNCIHGRCSEMCGGSENPDDDCAFDHGKCTIITFCANQYCSAYADAYMCQWFPGSGVACSGNNECVGTGNENTDEVCSMWVSPDNSINKMCSTANCDSSNPEACSPPGTNGCIASNAPPCFGDICLRFHDGTSVCSSVCNVDEDCPENMICSNMIVTLKAETGYCVPIESENPL